VKKKLRFAGKTKRDN